MRNVVSAVFDNERDAQTAVEWLSDNYMSDGAISVVRRHDGDMGVKGGATTLERPANTATECGADAGNGALAGLGIGAGVGVLFGLAAVMIPGIGPFITAGALGTYLGTAGGAAAAGAIVGGSSGALAGALAHWGLNEAESKYYASQVDRGGTFVAVDIDQTNLDQSTVLEAFRRYNGRFASTSSY